MARLTPALRAVALANSRDRGSFGSIATNNFFLVTALFLQKAGAFVFLLLGVILLFPLSADPLKKLPPERLALWPLNGRQRRLLRLITPWLAPPAWIILGLIAFAVYRTVSIGVVATVATFVVLGFLVSLIPDARRQGIFRYVPAFPGSLGQLSRNHFRQMLATLDFYAALLLAASAAIYRLITPRFEHDIALAMAVLSLLALSSHALCLFGLDGPQGFTRYRLLPLHGWRILAAKNGAFLAVAILLTLPLAPLSGLAGGLAALAFGNFPSVSEPREQVRWRFSSGASIGLGLLQTFAITSAAVLTDRFGPLILLPCGVAVAVSLWYCGRILDSPLSAFAD
jgi:hypothetical protein